MSSRLKNNKISYEAFLNTQLNFQVFDIGLKAYQVTFTWKENAIVN